MTRTRLRLVIHACVTATALGAAAQPPAPVPPVDFSGTRAVAVRVQWGGGRPRAWTGSIALVDDSGAAAREVRWRTLCTEPDAAAMVHAEAGRLVVHQPRAVSADGVEIVVPRIEGCRIVAALEPAGTADPPVTLDVAVADLLGEEAAAALDTDGNRLALRLAPDEPLRARIVGADGRDDVPVFAAGEKVRITVEPLLPVRADGAGEVELRLRLEGRRDEAQAFARSATLVPLPTPDVADAAAVRAATPFETVRFDVVLPAREGAWTLALEAVEGSRLGWSRTLATRTLGLTTLGAGRPAADGPAWRVVYELDPGSPRLHERLRRLPGVGLPQMPLPQMPLPSLTRSALPRLPSVPLPQVPPLSSMVPRLSGLLTAGHSRVEPHQLGPMLRLPPSESADEPAWEGVVVAGAQPGVPHVVEVEYPSDQHAVVGLAVLELDAAGGRVVPRHAGGFEVRRGEAGDEPRLGVHRFVFWPATRHPVVLLANQSSASAALFGRVRIRAGPTRLSAAAPATGRDVLAFLPDPGLAAFGGGADPAAWVAGAARAAEMLSAQGAAGALVVALGEGAALWPSRHTRQAPRWGSGAAEAAAPAAAPDLLAAACRIFEREGLRLVPALCCDAPLADLEAQLARGGAAAAGIACVGRDGTPRAVGPRAITHYNVLDPRVQRAVEDVVRELCGRLRGAAAVDGVALLVPHDGWLHLPGVAWGLDDATFARFRAAAGVEEPGDGADRFAARAALVEGPLREKWLDWRAAEVARFHGRLADVLAAHDERWSLYVMPTTLCAAGPLAERLRPSLLAAAIPAPLREAGLDPVRSTAHRRIVFVAPHVHGGDGSGSRGLLAAGNAATAREAAPAARRGAVILEQVRPLDVRAMVPHGPFGSALPVGPVPAADLATGAEAARAFAEVFAAADVEVVFDARLGLVTPEQRAADRAAIEALPAVPLVPVADLPVPLVVRTARGDATWVHVVNAAAAPVRATLVTAGRHGGAMDMASGAALEERGGQVVVELPAWGMRTLRLSGDVTVTAARLEYDAGLAAAVRDRVADLVRRRAALEEPVPLDVLDNPGFELGAAAADGQPTTPPGWELVEARRGSVALGVGADGTGRAAAFSSANGLSTLRSNPFPAPASGRVSVAAWLRIRPGDPQPPLRMSLEGVREDREYYRFAVVGGAAGGRPLSGEWQQFVLQVDDLPDAGLESLRVRFDLLGPGSVEIDEVRVFDLAFAEPERVRLTRQLTALESALEAGDLGSCVVALDGHWPRFLERHVPVPAAAPATASAPAATPAAARTGVLDRMRRLWQ